jgi:hypothetical protein
MPNNELPLLSSSSFSYFAKPLRRTVTGDDESRMNF